MNSKLMVLFFSLICLVETSFAHIEPRRMLFYTHKKMSAVCKEISSDPSDSSLNNDSYCFSFENRSNGSPSRVMTVCGFPEFKRSVLMSSFNKPVVVKVHALASIESGKVISHFQGVADQFDSDVSCVAMNLVEQGVQNRAIVANILSKCGINRVDLPLFLFFRNGQLQLPVRQGFHTMENLVGLIKKEFFSQKDSSQAVLESIPSSALCDWIPTHSSE